MLFVVEIISGNTRVLRCNTNLLMVLQKTSGALRTTDTHSAFSKSKVEYFVNITCLLKNRIFSDNPDIGRTVFDISRYIRSLCKEKAKF